MTTATPLDEEIGRLVQRFKLEVQPLQQVQNQLQHVQKEIERLVERELKWKGKLVGVRVNSKTMFVNKKYYQNVTETNKLIKQEWKLYEEKSKIQKQLQPTNQLMEDLIEVMKVRKKALIYETFFKEGGQIEDLKPFLASCNRKHRIRIRRNQRAARAQRESQHHEVAVGAVVGFSAVVSEQPVVLAAAAAAAAAAVAPLLQPDEDEVAEAEKDFKMISKLVKAGFVEEAMALGKASSLVLMEVEVHANTPSFWNGKKRPNRPPVSSKIWEWISSSLDSFSNFVASNSI